MKKSPWLVLLSISAIAILGWLALSSTDNSQRVAHETTAPFTQEDAVARIMMEGVPSQDEMQMTMDDAMMDAMTSFPYTHSGELEDVTNAETIRGTVYDSETSGQASYGFDGETFAAKATFQNLPIPAGDDFYEGWLVRRGPNFHFISTGDLTRKDGVYENHYVSEHDYTDHDFYVLTLEPNDGDPAPADHIIEGALTN